MSQLTNAMFGLRLAADALGDATTASVLRFHADAIGCLCVLPCVKRDGSPAFRVRDELLALQRRGVTLKTAAIALGIVAGELAIAIRTYVRLSPDAVRTFRRGIDAAHAAIELIEAESEVVACA